MKLARKKHKGDTLHIPLDFWFLSDENSTELEQTMRQG